MKRKKPYLLAGLVLLLFLLCTACGNAEGQIAPQDDPNEGLGGGMKIPSTISAAMRASGWARRTTNTITSSLTQTATGSCILLVMW